MGLFTRRQRDGPVGLEHQTNEMGTIPPTKEGHHSVHSHGNNQHNGLDTHNTSTEGRFDRKRDRKQPMVLPMSRRPPFGQWLKVTLLDILTMAAMGAIGLGVCYKYVVPGLQTPTDHIFRSMKLTLLHRGHFPSIMRMVKSFTRSSPILFAKKSSQSGQPQCWVSSSLLSSS